MANPHPAPQPWPPEKRGNSAASASPRTDATDETVGADPLLAFRSESSIRQDPPPAKTPAIKPAPASGAAATKVAPRFRWSTASAIGLIVIAAAVVIAGGVLSGQFVQARRLPTPPSPSVAALAVAEGTVTVNSRPEGAQVSVDSIPRGVTPLKLTLPAGDHNLELQNGAATRTVPLTVQAGVVLSQYLDLAPVAAQPSVGRLEVSSDPVGARVTVDGVARGVTPATLSNVSPGVHNVSIAGDDSTVTRTVTVAAGSTASVVVSLTPAGAAAGWASFHAPFELQVLEGGRVVGTTSVDRLMLPPGRHDFVLSNAALEFEAPMTVQVVVGKVASQVVTIPNGLLSINATPWADVLLDGQAIGTTPLANLSVPIGTHEIICRNPQLGERRQTVVVKAKSPARVGISFR